MSRPEATPDRAGAYLEAVLSLDPAVDAAEILRRRREFLGRPAIPGCGEAPGAGEAEEDEEARRAALERREKRERKARKEAIAAGRKRPAPVTRDFTAPSSKAPPPKKGTSPFTVVWVILIILRVIYAFTRSNK